jgi:adenylate kinase
MLDGFPRTLPQAERLDALLKQRHDKLDLVLNLHASEQEVLMRLAGTSAERFLA